MPTNPNMVAIQTVTVGSGGAATISFTSIPQTYTDLYILLSLRSNRASTSGDNVKVTFNSDTNSVYSYRLLYGDGSSAGSASGSSEAQTRIQYASANNQTASTFGSLNMYIPNYTSSNAKSISSEGASENNATEAYMGMTAGLWNPSTQAAITSITFAPFNGTAFNQYSTATLFGITKYT